MPNDSGCSGMIPGRDAGVQAGYADTFPLSVGAALSRDGEARLFPIVPHGPDAAPALPRSSRRALGRGSAAPQAVSTTLCEAHGDGACRLCLERRNERAR
ncbi:hypothetical protein GCM10025760_28650 [Microbacterium yannicii]|uniref:Uncharacterized protein n=1 Tax=Microbacterium yannicii TaxID=671622 RepID=A0ABP9MIQ0_9MICO